MITRLKKHACALALLLPVLRLVAADAPFQIGCEAYTFNRFTVYEAIEKTAQAGITAIELNQKQALSPSDRTPLGPNLTDAQLTGLKEELKSNGVAAVSYYTDIPNNEAGARKLFTFARDLGMRSLTTESVEAIGLIEKLVKEYDIRVGFHEHQKTADANYKLWNPEYLRDFLKGRDPRIGACGDMGHWASSGIKPLDAIKTLDGRLLNVHLKDRPEIGRAMHDTILGTGASDIPGVLRELRRQHFDGCLIIEYENKFDNNVADVKKCAEFIRNFEAAEK